MNTETIADYNRRAPSWARVVGVIESGTVRCDDCADYLTVAYTENTDDVSVLFATDDTDGMTCDQCLGAVGLSWEHYSWPC